MPFEEKRLRKVSLLKSGWRLCRKGSLGWPNIFGGSIAAAESSSARAFLHEVMSSEPSVSTPKQKKRVPQLVAFYEEIGTPKTRKKRSNTDAAPEEPTMSPPKKQKTEEVEEEVITEPMEVVEETVAVEEEVEAVKTKEPRSSRKSRRTKELTLSKFSKRIFSATEILSTERTYVEALQQLHKVRNNFFGRLSFPFSRCFCVPIDLFAAIPPISPHVRLNTTDLPSHMPGWMPPGRQNPNHPLGLS